MDGLDTQETGTNDILDKQIDLLGGALFILLGGGLLLAFFALGGPAMSARSEN